MSDFYKSTEVLNTSLQTIAAWAEHLHAMPLTETDFEKCKDELSKISQKKLPAAVQSVNKLFDRFLATP